MALSPKECRLLLYPAIDLRDGKCVRLQQGDYSKETVFGEDPARMATRWVEQGAEWLHLVDLDGAKAGQPTNESSVRSILEAVSVPCQLGGGLRTEQDIERVLAWGVSRVILGTRALREPEWCERMARAHPGKVALGLDAKDGLVALEGWQESSTTSALDLAKRCSDWPLAAIIYTDISKDGMLAGPNLETTKELAGAVSVPVIASGGVTTTNDLDNLAGIGVAGAIIGRALYEGSIDLKEAIGKFSSS